MQTTPCFAVPVSDPDDPHSSPIFRNPTSPERLVTNFEPPVRSVYEIFKRSALKWPERKCLGSQVKADDTITYKWLSYAEVDQRVNQAASVLKKKGLVSDERKHVALMAPLSIEWLIFDLAINLLGAISVPINTRLSPPHLVALVTNSSHSIVGTNEELIKLAEAGLDCSSFRILTLNGASEDLLKKTGQIAIIDYSQEAKQIPLDNQLEYATDIDAVASIAYTSGTTQAPRGTLISNRNLVSARAALDQMAEFEQNEGKQKTYLLYLPVVHIMGRSSVYSNYACGAAIGISGGGLPHRVMEDLQILKPSELFAVPRTLVKIYSKLKGIIVQQKEDIHLSVSEALKTGVVSEEVQGLFAKLREVLGGNIQRILTGSATVLPEIVHFLRLVLKCEIVVGYGLTECAGVTFYTPKGDKSTGHVGSPLSALQFKLVDVPDLGYLVTDKPFPRGQIWIRGDVVFKGYFKNEKETEGKLEKGWLKTGDIGMLLEGNALQIIDRKDNLFKLQQGIFIAPQRLEQIYSNCAIIQDIFVYGDGSRRFLVALIVADPLLSKGKSETEVRERVEAQMQSVGHQFGLLNLEQIKGHFLLQHKPFIACGLLTPTMKLKRKQATSYFASQIEALYASEETP